MRLRHRYSVDMRGPDHATLRNAMFVNLLLPLNGRQRNYPPSIAAPNTSPLRASPSYCGNEASIRMSRRPQNAATTPSTT